jgi:hypothetical protein
MKARHYLASAVLLGFLATPARAAVLDTVGQTTGGTLGSDPVADFAFAGSLQMYGPGGVPVLAQPDKTIKGTISLDMVTAGGTAHMASDVGFFGIQWRMHDVSLSACGADLTVNTNLQFDWNKNFNIPVFSKFRLKPALNPNVTSWKGVTDGMTFTVEEVDTDGDGIPGQRMTSGPFPGFTPVFTGTAKATGVRPGYYRNDHVKVPGGSTPSCTPLGPSVGGFM